MKRRNLLLAGGGLFVGAALPWWLDPRHVIAGGVDDADVDALRSSWREALPPGVEPPRPDDTLSVTEDEWRERLDPAAFRVLFEDGTEPAGSSPLDREKRTGLFACIACDLPLFASTMKYDSGTGWPSFFTTIPGHLGTSKDFKLIVPRTEYHCVRCGGHHGHVFDDGPEPTAERWCNNGVALRFLPSDGAAPVTG